MFHGSHFFSKGSFKDENSTSAQILLWGAIDALPKKKKNWKVGDRGFEPRSEMDSSRKETKYFPRSLVKMQFSNPLSGGQCQFIHLTIMRTFSWHSLAYMCTKVA